MASYCSEIGQNLFSWHCCFSLFLVGMWAGHDSIICSMLYGEVWQYSHGLPIFSIVGAPNLARVYLVVVYFEVDLIFSYLWYYCVEFSAFLAAVPWCLLKCYIFLFFLSRVQFCFAI